jgi:hypothetical protein
VLLDSDGEKIGVVDERYPGRSYMPCFFPAPSKQTQRLVQYSSSPRQVLVLESMPCLTSSPAHGAQSIQAGEWCPHPHDKSRLSPRYLPTLNPRIAGSSGSVNGGRLRAGKHIAAAKVALAGVMRRGRAIAEVYGEDV